MSVMINSDVSQRLSTSSRLERIPNSSSMLKLVSLLLVVAMLDGVDLAGMGFMMPLLGKAWKLIPTQLGYLASINYVGMFIGAIVCGNLADRFGRKPMLISTMIIWGVAGIAFAWAPNVEVLFISRLIFGIGIGACVPVGQTMLSESVPSKLRAKYITAFYTVLIVGMSFTGLLTMLLMPYMSWRGIFFVEALFALWAVVLWKYMPESALWLENKGRYQEADQIVDLYEVKTQKSTGQPLPLVAAPATPATDQKQGGRSSFLDLFTKENIRVTLMCTIWMSTNLAAFYGINTWLTTMLVGKGFAIIKSMGYVSLIYLGGVPAYFLISYLTEKMGRKWLVVLMSFLTAVAAYFYGQAPTLVWVIATGLFYMFVQCGLNVITSVYQPELFETRMRGTGVGYSSSCGRLGAIAGPFILGYVLTNYGVSSVMLAAVGLNLVSGLAVAVLGHETRGKVF